MTRSSRRGLGTLALVLVWQTGEAAAQYKVGGGLGSNVARFGTSAQTPPTPGSGPENARSSITWGLGNTPSPGLNGKYNCRPGGNNCFPSACSPFVYYGGYYPGLAYGYSGYSYSGPYYSANSYDPYANQLAGQNELLQQQIAQLQNQNDLLRDAKANNQPKKLAKNQAQVDRDKRLQQETRAQKYVTGGTRLFNAGSYHRAADQFRLAIKQVGDDPTPHFYLAQSLFAMGKYHEAAQAIKDGLKLNPEWLEVDFDMKSMYGNAGDLLTQLRDLGKDLKANPLDRNALFLLGFELFVTGEKERAKIILEQAARLEADDRHLQPFFDYFDKQPNAKLDANEVPRPALVIPPGAG
ncbi:MAG: tetratricopeptide repeat protein [Planctomycetota bacterium]